jgi:hypothetical protein
MCVCVQSVCVHVQIVCMSVLCMYVCVCMCGGVGKVYPYIHTYIYICIYKNIYTHMYAYLRVRLNQFQNIRVCMGAMRKGVRTLTLTNQGVCTYNT